MVGIPSEAGGDPSSNQAQKENDLQRMQQEINEVKQRLQREEERAKTVAD